MPIPANGRSIKVVLLTLSLLSTVIVHLPSLPLGVQAAGQQFLYLTGHEHTWNLFAANPRDVSLSMLGELTLADGTIERWQPSEHGGAFGDLVHYRPVRWVEYQYGRRDPVGLLALARWLARNAVSEPVRVELKLEETRTPLPGDPKAQPTVETLLVYKPLVEP